MVALLVAGCGTTVPVAERAALPSAPGDVAPDTAASRAGAAPGSSGGTSSTTGAGQGSNSTGTSTPAGPAGGSTGAGAPSAGSRPAASLGPKVTAPLEIGYLGASSPAAVNAALGTSGGTQETPQHAFAYLVRALNARGGLAGRRISAVTAFIDPTSSNYDTQAQAACTTFTQDHHVVAVLAQEDFYYSQNFSACLNKARVPEIEAITGGVDGATLAASPLLYSVSAPTVERRFTAMIDGLAGNGYLTKKSKIGIILEDCPYNERAYNKAVAPALQAHGLSANVRKISCVHGFGDAAAAIAAFQNQVLPFAAAKVDRVMFMSGFEGIGLQYFEQQAAQQGYQPHYALTSTANAGENTAKLSDGALQRLQGVGWEPLLDSLKLLPNSAATGRCRALYKGYPPAASRSNNRYNEMLCELFFSYEAMLVKSNGHSDPHSISAAASALGTSYVSPLALAGATRYSSGRKDAPELFARFGYLPDCRCIGYTGPPRRIA
jgi:hypothetical protein